MNQNQQQQQHNFYSKHQGLEGIEENSGIAHKSSDHREDYEESKHVTDQIEKFLFNDDEKEFKKAPPPGFGDKTLIQSHKERPIGESQKSRVKAMSEDFSLFKKSNFVNTKNPPFNNLQYFYNTNIMGEKQE